MGGGEITLESLIAEISRVLFAKLQLSARRNNLVVDVSYQLYLMVQQNDVSKRSEYLLRMNVSEARCK